MKHLVKACSVLLLISFFACNNQQKQQDNPGAGGPIHNPDQREGYPASQNR
jgi:hypothetical protein